MASAGPASTDESAPVGGEAPDEGRLRARLEELGASAASLAHELRSPLAAMELLAGLMKTRLEDPECQRLLDDLIAEQRHVATLIDRCLGYVRDVPLRLRPTPLRALLQEAWEVARVRVPYAGRLELEPGPELAAMLDAGQLRTALIDLLVNALQALRDAPPDAPLIVLAAGRLEPGRVRVEIRDNGPGIPADVQERIFQPFFTTRRAGTGLGLANARKVVGAHGGRIEVESLRGRGCAVRLLLPSEGPSDGTPGSGGRT